MLKFIFLAVGIYFLMGGYLYLVQRDMMYFPTRENNLVDAEVLWLDSEQVHLKIWRINQGQPAILYFGGNAESVEYNIPDFKRMFSDYSVYLVNYRGYGGSSGSPTEQGLMTDALAIYDMISPDHSSVSVIGRSLGSAVAIHLAANRDIKKLVLITPFDSLKNVAQSHYPLFPVKWFMKDPYDITSQAGSIGNPTLILTAQHDRIIPRKHSQNLLSALNKASVEAHTIAGTGHNDISFNPAFDTFLAEFFNRPEN